MLVFGFLLALLPRNMRVYIRDGSAQLYVLQMLKRCVICLLLFSGTRQRFADCKIFILWGQCEMFVFGFLLALLPRNMLVYLRNMLVYLRNMLVYLRNMLGYLRNMLVYLRNMLVYLRNMLVYLRNMLVYLRDGSARTILREIEVADPAFYPTQSKYTDTGPTSPSAVLITLGAVATGVPVLKSLVGLDPQKSPPGIDPRVCGTETEVADPTLHLT